MDFLDRGTMLKKRPSRTKEVLLPELGGKVTIRALTEGERSRYEASFLDKAGKPRVSTIEAARRKLIVESVIDPDGNRMFTEADMPALAELDSAALSRIYNEARELSGFEESDIESLVGNSSAPSGDGSPSV